MSKGLFKRIVGGVVASFLCITSVPFVEKEMTANAAKVLTTSPGHTQETGWYNDFHHEIWQADTPNSSTMTLSDNGGGFSTSWKCGPDGSRGNFLARRGLFYDLGNTKHWQDYGGFTCDFDCSWTAGNSGNSRICIYGWTQNPLVEYYIIEDWKNWRPTSNSAKQVTIDGSVYDVFTNPMNSYTIEGNKAFTQYISVRRDTRTKGTISISEHFKAWEDLGMKMGGLYEVAFNVEGWESDGQATVDCTIKEGSNPIVTTGPGTTTTTTTQKPVEPDTNGDYATEDFESGKGDWSGRGGASVSTDTKNYYDGKSSLAITGRTDNWNGAEIDLSSSTFVPGQTYSFSTAVLQKSGSAVDMKMTLQYSKGGTESYDEVASATAKSGEWTKLENAEFTIPSGATSVKLYIEAPDSLTDFNIDAVQLSKSGKKSSVVNGQGVVDGSGTTVTTGTTSSGQTVTTVTTTGGGKANGNIASHQNNDYTYDANGTGFKDYMGKYFRLGTCVNAWNIQKQDIQNFIKKNFNSITCENEMKPSEICVQSQSSGDNIVVSLQKADPILKFCEQNGIGLRGHTFVWYSQTPEWIFKENMQTNSGGFVSPETMNKRLESMIKNTFAELKKNYPNLKIYSYDVCNELFKNDGGGFRGDGSESSNWWAVYHDDSFVINAFKYARQYAPEGCKLYMNDYNEYFVKKADDLYNMAKKIQAAGDYIDGIGMQSHMHAADFGKTGSATKSNDPQFGTYADAIDKFNSLGLDVQITELDVTNCADEKGASLFVDIFKVAMERSLNISSLTLWGHCDSASWRNDYEDGGKPLPFDSNCQPKAFYNDIIALSGKIEPGPVEETTTTTTTTVTTTTTTTIVTSTTSTTSSGSTPEAKNPGDANCDGQVNMADAVFIMQCLSNPDKYKMSSEGEANADVDGSGDITNKDALMIQQYKLGIITELGQKKNDPVTTPSSTTTRANNTTTTTTSKAATTTTTTAATTTTTAEVKADYFTANFDSSVGNWESRGDASVSLDKDNYYDGGSSLKVSGRTKEWNGAALSLNSTFKAGSTYSFSAAVLQKASASDTFKLSLQYKDASGQTSYDSIAEATVEKNTWTKLENAAYTIPEGATDLLLYVETAASTIAFYIDDVAVAASGTKSTVVNGKGVVSEEPESKVDPSKKLVAISFDDGAVGNSPTDSSMRIINAIADAGWHATFFYVSSWINTPGKEEEVKYAYSKGMEIANHTNTHPNLSEKSSNEIRSEFDTCHAKLKSIIGAEPAKLMRLPYLATNSTVEQTLNDVALISCSVDSGDWNNGNKNSCVNAIKTAAQQGRLENAIVLFHETYSFTADAIEELIPWLQENGYQIVTVSEMFEARGKQLKGGVVYKNA